MVDLVSSISTAMDIARKLYALDKKVGEADFKMLLADLTSGLGDAKLEAANLKIELAEAKVRIVELERQAARVEAEEPELHDGGYVFGDRTRHYCTGCYDTQGKKILLSEQPRDFQDLGKWLCPACKNLFGGPAF